MSKFSPAREGVPLLPGLPLFSRGKVRDTYVLPSFPNLLLVVATDGISIFDFVLNALVPLKGAILNAMSHFWLQMLEQYGIPTHFVAAGTAIDKYLPQSLRGNADLQSRAMVVNKLEMSPIEFIGRGHLTGSGLASYRENGKICGHLLPVGLYDGAKLPFILDTPTTKAESGHDVAMDAADIGEQYPEETYRLLQIFQIISGYARDRGIIFADTKLEFGVDDAGNIRLGDEVGTPDSSRWWSWQILCSQVAAMQR